MGRWKREVVVVVVGEQFTESVYSVAYRGDTDNNPGLLLSKERLFFGCHCSYRFRLVVLVE